MKFLTRVNKNIYINVLRASEGVIPKDENL